MATLFLWTFADAASLRVRRAPVLAAEADRTRRLGLSDLCLLPAARYTAISSRPTCIAPSRIIPPPWSTSPPAHSCRRPGPSQELMPTWIEKQKYLIDFTEL
jgi:hypothetical protein